MSTQPRLPPQLDGASLEQIEGALLCRALREYVPRAWAQCQPTVPFVHNWHHDAISDHLEAVSLGQISHMLISVAPRHTKSWEVAVFWPTWHWTRWPATQWVFASYSKDFAVRDAIYSRRLMDTPWYQARWGCSCEERPHAEWCNAFRWTTDQNVKEKYENDRGGRRLTAGVEAGTTGEGGDILVFDDALDILKANSDAARHNANTYISQVFLGRANDPGSARVVGIAQRTHTDDPTGHLLKESPLPWFHLKLPEEYVPRVQVDVHQQQDPREVSPIGWQDPRTEEEELLWPDRFTRAFIESEKITKGPYGYACTPAETPILMSDWTCRSIATVRPGDRVVGFVRGTPDARAKLVPATVRRTFEREAQVVRLVLASGREVRCTADHRWYTGRGKDGAAKTRPSYAPAKLGRRLLYVDDPQVAGSSPEEQRLWCYLAGIFDGEGTITRGVRAGQVRGGIIQISQSPGANPNVWSHLQEILRRLRVSFRTWQAEAPTNKPRWSSRGQITIHDSPRVAINLLRYAEPAKRALLEEFLFARGHMFVRAEDPVVAIEADRVERVFALETTTGNYIAWGYASSNSQYQQTPSPIEGGILRRDWWRFWIPRGLEPQAKAPLLQPVRSAEGVEYPPAVELPDFLTDREGGLDELLLSMDTSFKDEALQIRKGKPPDPMSLGAWGRRGAACYLLDRVNKRVDVEGAIEALADMSQRFPQAVRKVIEDKANGPAIMALLRRRVGGLTPATPTLSKAARVMTAGGTEKDRDARAMSMVALLAAHNVYLPHPALAPWVWEYIEQHANFPNGANDDDVDMTSQALMMLQPWIWREQDRAQTEVLNQGGLPPILDTNELMRRRLYAASGIAPEPGRRPEYPTNGTNGKRTQPRVPFADPYRRGRNGR
jgi:predicted phage terminase large subunit-like protein